MRLKHILRQVEPDRGNLRHDRPPLWILTDPPWHIDAVGGRSHHQSLDSGPTTRDHIELHFTEQVSVAMRSALSVVVPTMARTWPSRQVGLVTRTVVNHRIAREAGPVPPAQKMLLGPANPAKLSRAEFRVCLLLSRGLSTLGVAEELSVSEATVRSHLRSIYAKTETSSLAELVFNLLRIRPDASALSDLRCA